MTRTHPRARRGCRTLAEAYISNGLLMARRGRWSIVFTSKGEEVVSWFERCRRDHRG